MCSQLLINAVTVQVKHYFTSPVRRLTRTFESMESFSTSLREMLSVTLGAKR